MPLLAAFKRLIDADACRADREPDEVTTREFTEGKTERMARACRNRTGGYDVAVFAGQKGLLGTHFKKTATLRTDTGLVRAVIILDDWAKAQRKTPARESMAPSFGGGALVDNVAAAKGWRHYLSPG